MSAQSETIAVVGSTPFAWLLAGLLAADHSRAVVLLSDPPDPNRLWPRPSASIVPMARPEAWMLMHDHGADALRRITRIAPRAVERVKGQMSAHTADAIAAIGHMRGIMAGLGYLIEPVSSAKGQLSVTIGDARIFNPGRLVEAFAQWLAKENVAVVNSARGLKVRKDGTANFGATTIDKVVLADDEAIIEWLSDEEIATFGHVEPFVGIASAPMRMLERRLLFDLDNGAALCQFSGGSIQGAAIDADGLGLERIAHCLPKGVTGRLAGQTQFRRIVPHDGAPILGATRRARTFSIAGLGGLDLMLAPVLARSIVGTGTADEAEWVASHGADLRQPRSNVAEFISHPAGRGLQ